MHKTIVVQSPAGRSAEQQTLDTTQCSRKQQVSGPWVDGLGSLIIHDIARDGYSDCMKSLGYVVRQEQPLNSWLQIPSAITHDFSPVPSDYCPDCVMPSRDVLAI